MAYIPMGIFCQHLRFSKKCEHCRLRAIWIAGMEKTLNSLDELDYNGTPFEVEKS